MNTNAILIDTGPLVALLRRDDAQHAACDAVAKTVGLPLWSCWPVITEAAYLLRKSPQTVRKLLAYCDGSLIEIFPLGKLDLAGMDAILAMYSDQRFDLADVALMQLAHREGIDKVFTLDRRHFSVFRNHAGQALTLLP